MSLLFSHTPRTPSPRRRRPQALARFALAAVSVLPPAALSFAPAAARAQTQPPSVTREISGGEVHTMGLRLTPGQFVRAVFDQRGVDIVLTLKGPGGGELLKVDSPVGEWGPEPLFFEVASGGYYTIEVRPRRNAAGPGRYEFSMTARRATPNDVYRFPAERAFAEATRALSGGGPDALTRAAAEYEEALRLFRSLGDQRGEITTLVTAAAVAQALGESGRALRHYGDALALLRTTADSAGEARALSAVAHVHYSLGDRERALSCFRQALALFRAAGDGRTAAYTLNNIAHVFDSRGEGQEALAYYEQALRLFRAEGDRRGEAVALNNIGLVYDSLGEKAKARRSFEEAMAVFEEEADCLAIGPTLSNLAAFELESGDRQKALDYLARALAVQHAVGDREGEATTLNNMGFVHHSGGDAARAFEHFHRALALGREARSRKAEGDTLANMMFASRARARGGPAVFYGKQAVTAYQEVRGSIPPLDKEAQKSFLKPREVVYHRLAELLIERGRLPEAQQVVGFLKQEEYFQFVRRDGGEGASSAKAASLTPEEAAAGKRYQEIAGQITVRGRQRAELLQKAARTAEEDRQLAALDSELAVANQAFQSFLDRLSAEFGDTRQAARVEQVRESQALMEDLRELGKGAVAVYTLVGEEKYRVILITPDAQVAREYPVRAADLNKKVAAFREALQDNSQDPRPLAQELYRIVVGPVSKDLEQAGAETLMWSLDGALRYVPVAALHDGKQYMVERYRNVVFTPASMARIKDAPSAQWRALGFGVSKAYGDFSALPSVPEELRGIIRGADGGAGVLPGEISLDDAFTLDAFKQGLRQRFPLVHVASHFQFQPGNETDSFLLMGDGSRLSLAQIKVAQNLFGGVELLTLSACNTATGGGEGDGKEVEGFAVLAQRQGAKAVVASLWPVSDASTRLLMQEFYRLRGQQPETLKAEALRRAQLALLRGGASPQADALASGGQSRGLTVAGGVKLNFSHPYFWAPFILIGNWR